MPDSAAHKSPAADTRELIALDHAHVWHPFTPMKQWRENDPIVIDRGEGEFLIDTDGRRYIDGVSSLWCNVHGHRVPAIDAAIRAQLDKISHSTLLGLAGESSIRLAAALIRRCPGRLNKVFYSDAGATALEVAFKMAVGYWHHQGQPAKTRFIGFHGAYHGDTTGSMSVGYSEAFHKPFLAMVFPTFFAPITDACRPPAAMLADVSHSPGVWPSEDESFNARLMDHCLRELEKLLREHAHETAAIVIEPIMQGAAGMICQPNGFLRRVAQLARQYGVLLIADEVATSFGRTGRLFACEHELDEQFTQPDILCLAKGITGGYLPLAATVCTDEIEQAFCGELHERRTLYHGHTYTGNALGCAAALASLELFRLDEPGNSLLDHIHASAGIIRDRLNVLRDYPHVLDVRQRGLMVGIELCRDRATREPLDFTKRTAAGVCMAMRPQGLIIRPLGDVVVLMPIPAMPHASLHQMLDIATRTILNWQFH